MVLARDIAFDKACVCAELFRECLALRRDVQADDVGAVAGEKRSVTVNFPADYRAGELAGKTAIFATDINVRATWFSS